MQKNKIAQKIEHSKTVQIFTNDPDMIRATLPRLMGKYVTFSNGCKIDLKSQNGYFIGTNPYGIDAMFDENDSWMDALISWVEYWNKDRTESGLLMTECCA